MRIKLLKSFLVVFLFWWLLTACLWSVADPVTNLLGLQRIAHLASFAGLHLAVPRSISVLDALDVQLRVLHAWTLPVTLATLVFTIIGLVVVWVWTLKHHRDRSNRIAKSDEYRGVSTSLGPLPALGTPQSVTIELRSSTEALSVISSEERTLLADVLGIIAANQEVFAGENRPAGSLLQRTLSAAHEALARRHHPGLAAIAAAASELGKITAWTKDEEGAWVRTKSEQREAARILSALPSWFALPSTDRLAVLFAVKYRGRPEQVPEIARDPEVYRLARSLLETEVSSGSQVVEEIRQKVYEQRDPETEILEVFERELAILPFQSPGLPKNIPAAGWKRNGRTYLLENRLIENLLPKLSAEVRATFAPGGRDKSARISPMTAALLRVFSGRGWLVIEHEKDKVLPSEALWVITAGKLEFSRVIILDLPAELLEKLPAKDSYYEVLVKRPLFQSVIQSSVSKEDLMGGMLRPKPASPAKTPDPLAEEKASSDA